MSDEPRPGNNVSPTPSLGSTGSIGWVAGVVGGAVVTGDVDVDVGDVSSLIDSVVVVGVVASGSARRATPLGDPSVHATANAMPSSRIAAIWVFPQSNSSSGARGARGTA